MGVEILVKMLVKHGVKDFAVIGSVLDSIDDEKKIIVS